MTRNEARFPADVAYRLQGTTNNGDVTIDGWRFRKGQGKLLSIRGTKVVDGTYTYYQVSYVIAIRHYILDENGSKDYERCWHRRVRNEGLYQKATDPDDGKTWYGRIKDTDGNPITEPVALDENGYSVDLKEDGTPIKEIFLLFNMPPGSADWTPLRLS
jgi:hypothetical protein